MRAPSLLIRLVLAACLLLSQQALVAHAISHTVKAVQQDSTPDKHRVCDLCVLSAQLKDALLDQAKLVVEAMPQPRVQASAWAARVPSTSPAYRSRAPPLS
jgi:hypothetical protein